MWMFGVRTKFSRLNLRYMSAYIHFELWWALDRLWNIFVTFYISCALVFFQSIEFVSNCDNGCDRDKGWDVWACAALCCRSELRMGLEPFWGQPRCAYVCAELWMRSGRWKTVLWTLDWCSSVRSRTYCVEPRSDTVSISIEWFHTSDPVFVQNSERGKAVEYSGTPSQRTRRTASSR